MDDYIGRINRVIDYIENNLAGNFTLVELANVANFSKYHFHRVFFSLMGETIMRFIQRIRLERAATMLVYRYNESVTTIAFDSGFTSSAAFSKAFREKFNCSPTEWRKRSLYSNQQQLNSNFGKTESNLIKERPPSPSILEMKTGC